MARNWPFLVALLVATLFHLSMISVFSVVIWLPRKDMHYYSMEIVQSQPARTQRAAASPRKAALRLPNADSLLAGVPNAEPLATTPIEDTLEAGPAIELPRLAFADFERLRMRAESLRIRSRFADPFEQKRADSWEWFTQELRGIGTAITRLGAPEQDARNQGPQRIEPAPAPGFAAYIQWMSEPRGRRLLFSSPLQTLWDLEPQGFSGPVALAFTVNPQGKVTDVQIPVEDEAGVAASIGRALLKYRFEPLQGGEARDQRATLLVTTAEGARP